MFTARDPTADPLSIVGAHPRLWPNITVGGGREQRIRELGSTSRRVRRQPECFIDGDTARRPVLEYDPYAASEAIEVSRRWGQVINPNVGSSSRCGCLPFPPDGVVPAGQPASCRRGRAQWSGRNRAMTMLSLEAYAGRPALHGIAALSDIAPKPRTERSDPSAEALWALSRGWPE